MATLDIPPEAWPFLGGGLLVLWTVREFLGYLRQRHRDEGAPDTAARLFEKLDSLGEKLDKLDEGCARVERTVQALWDVHDDVDEDGVHKWKIRPSLVRTIEAIESHQGELIEILRTHGAALERLGLGLETLIDLARRPAPGAGQ